MTPDEIARLNATMARLRRAAEIERQARIEVDRLTRRAWQFGATDLLISGALGIPFDAARMRRRRLKQGRKTRTRRSAS